MPAPKQATPAAVPAVTPVSKGEVAVFQKPRLPWSDHIERAYGEMGVTKASWRALIDAVYPAAKSVDSVVLALSYCKARKLDPFKRPVHIVPVWDSDKRGFVDTVWPGISEIRTTAVRTGCYAGCDPAAFGEMKERTFRGEVGKDKEKREITLKFPEWAQVTVHRMIQGQRVPIAGPRVYWEETYATIGRTELPNAMWEKRTRGQLEKCAEAAALRRAFPEELGSDYIADEAERAPGFYAGTQAAVIEAKPRTSAAAGATLDALVSDHGEPAETVNPETGEITDTLSDYLTGMLAEYGACKDDAEREAVTTTVHDSVGGCLVRGEITKERADALHAQWVELTAGRK